jgi:hypothetical protein
MPARRRRPPRKNPRIAPERLRTAGDLAALQRAMWTLIARPLTADGRMPRRWKDGRSTAALAAQIAKPNDRLSSLDRLEIYSRMYWFRVLDSLYDDSPGLRAALGTERFMKLAEAYLVKYPSRSFTLRDLPARLAKFIREEPRHTRPHTALCHDLARLEWARVEVFDSASRPVFTAADLAGADPATLRLGLQPYLQFLAFDYPVDDFLIAAKQREELSRGDASNTNLAAGHRRARRLRLPRPGKTWLAVHRLDNTLYFKRLEPAAYRILRAIRAGHTLDRALAAGIPRGRAAATADWAAKVQGWFRTWMELGWFCRR